MFLEVSGSFGNLAPTCVYVCLLVRDFGNLIRRAQVCEETLKHVSRCVLVFRGCVPRGFLFGEAV